MLVLIAKTACDVIVINFKGHLCWLYAIIAMLLKQFLRLMNLCTPCLYLDGKGVIKIAKERNATQKSVLHGVRLRAFYSH